MQFVVDIIEVHNWITGILQEQRGQTQRPTADWNIDLGMQFATNITTPPLPALGWFLGLDYYRTNGLLTRNDLIPTRA